MDDDSSQPPTERRRLHRRHTDITPEVRTPEALVVDPDRDQCDLARFTLAVGGIATLTTHDGASAVTMARDHQPDVIITELALPHVDGFTLLDRLHTSPWTSSIPVVVFTASAERTFETRARAAGAAAVLHKPSPPERLLETIEGLLHHTNPAVRQERRLREVLLSLRRIARYYSPDPLARERLSRLINRLQESVLMIDDEGHTLAHGAVTASMQQASRDLARRCAAAAAGAASDDPVLRRVPGHDEANGPPGDLPSLLPHAICVDSGIAGLHFAALLNL